MKSIFLLWLVVDMVHPIIFPKSIVFMDVKLGVVKDNVKLVDVENDVKPVDIKVDVKAVDVEVDVREQITSKHEFLFENICSNGSARRPTNWGLAL